MHNNNSPFCSRKVIVALLTGLTLVILLLTYQTQLRNNDDYSMLYDINSMITNHEKESTPILTQFVTVPLVFLNNEKSSGSSSSGIGDSASASSYQIKHLDIPYQARPSAPIRQMHIKDLMHDSEEEHKTDLSSSSQRQPLLLTGWEDFNRNNMKQFLHLMEKQNFLTQFGNYTQYVKDEFVQPLMDDQNEKCIAPSSAILKMMETSKNNLLFFTNDVESPDFFKSLLEHYDPPSPLNYARRKLSENSESEKISEDVQGEDSSFGGFHVFSAMVKESYHGFHQHDDAQIYQIHGRKMWWFAPPDAERPKKVSPCLFLKSGQRHHLESILPENWMSVLQQPGDTVFVPKGWWHATCALDDWTVAVGMQRGQPHRLDQKFQALPQPFVSNLVNDGQNHLLLDERKHPMPWKDRIRFNEKMTQCGVKYNFDNLESWVWFNGDLNKYYNQLIQSDSKRDPDNIKSYAVHRWMGRERSTLIHYELIYASIKQYFDNADNSNLKVLDAGCGLGAGLMWFERYGPTKWDLTGHTISSEQLKFINELPKHKFKALLKSYDDLDYQKLNVIYSIEAFIHSPNEYNTLQVWSKALQENGIIVIIDDFLSVGVDKNADDVQLFSKAWMGNVLQTTSSLSAIAERYGLELVMDRDLGSEYQIVKNNYRNKLPEISPTSKKSHQGWLGSGMRQKLMVEGKITYRMIVFQKIIRGKSNVHLSAPTCKSVQARSSNDPSLQIEEVKAEHKTGRGEKGGSTQRCISGWYCCGKGLEWWQNLEENRTHNTAYLKLDKSLFGDYMDKMVKNLNLFYSELSLGVSGKFLDIGGTGR